MVPATPLGFDITIEVIATPPHTVWLLLVTLTVGVGLTCTVAVMGLPGQPPILAVMVNVVVTDAFVEFINAPLMSPVPLAAIPVKVPVLSLVQVNTADGVALVSAIVVIAAPEQTAWLDGVAVIFGPGFTVTVAVMPGPAHPFDTGTIVNVTVTGEEVVFVKAPLIFPLPLAAIPVTVPVLSLVQV